jgi:glutaredoxin
MILLFTSDHCTWCDVLKRMLDEESDALGLLQPIFEVDVDKHQYIAETYEILVVPTLVAGMQKISGVPTQSDLRSFLLHLNPVTQFRSERGAPSLVLREVRNLRESEVEEKSVVRTL